MELVDKLSTTLETGLAALIFHYLGVSVRRHEYGAPAAGSVTQGRSEPSSGLPARAWIARGPACVSKTPSRTATAPSCWRSQYVRGVTVLPFVMRCKSSVADDDDDGGAVAVGVDAAVLALEHRLALASNSHRGADGLREPGFPSCWLVFEDRDGWSHGQRSRDSRSSRNVESSAMVGAVSLEVCAGSVPRQSGRLEES